jgi:protein-arginine kinase activator protein McsA
MVMTSEEKYELNPKRCMNCNEVLGYTKRYNKFCDRSCSATFNNKGVCRTGTPTTKQCKHCGKPLIRNSRTYCDNKCQWDYKWELLKEEIESGEYVKKYSEAVTRPQIKKYLIETRGHKCEICGITEWMGQPVPLVCDHIDGDATNGDLKNFRVVCGNCDMQLPTFAGRNKGNGTRTCRQR